MLLIITGTADGLLKFINIDDLERPCSPQKTFIVNFPQFLAVAHVLRVNCDKMAGGTPRQPACEVFCINADLSNSSLDPPSSRGIKEEVSL